MFKLSIAIITYNEEKNIQRCLESVLPIADEIVVVDSVSTDRTEEIALSFQNKTSLKFIKQPFLGYIEQKNFALDHTTFDYVLSLDADEALSAELLQSIKEAKRNFKANAYSFHRLTHYVDQWIYHSGWYPDTKLRLVHKNFARWSGVNPHDILTLKVDTAIVHLKGDLLHYSYDSISSHLTQTNKFTTIAAKAAFEKGQRANLFQIVTRPFFKFLRDYVFKRGFLDGRYGFIICFINALAAMLKYAKLYEIQRGKNP